MMRSAARFASPQQQQQVQSRKRSSFPNLARDFYINPYTGDNLNGGEREGGLVPTVFKKWIAEESIEKLFKGIFHDQVICFSDATVAAFEEDMILPPKPDNDATNEQKAAFEKSKEKAASAQKALTNNAKGKGERNETAGRILHHIIRLGVSANVMTQLSTTWMENPGEHHAHLEEVLEFLEERSNDIAAIKEEIVQKMLTHFNVARTPEQVMLNLGKLLEINVIEQDKLMKKNPANPDELINKDDSYPATTELVLLRTFEKFIADPCEAVKTLRAVVSTAINKKKSLEWTSDRLKQTIQNYRPSAIQQPQPQPLAIRAHAATTSFQYFGSISSSCQNNSVRQPLPQLEQPLSKHVCLVEPTLRPTHYYHPGSRSTSGNGTTGGSRTNRPKSKSGNYRRRQNHLQNMQLFN